MPTNSGALSLRNVTPISKETVKSRSRIITTSTQIISRSKSKQRDAETEKPEETKVQAKSHGEQAQIRDKRWRKRKGVEETSSIQTQKRAHGPMLKLSKLFMFIISCSWPLFATCLIVSISSAAPLLPSARSEPEVEATTTTTSESNNNKENFSRNERNGNFSLETGSDYPTSSLTAAAAAENGSHLLLLFALLVLINLIVILGNILVILAVYATAKLRNVTNIFIVSLATADLLLGVFVLPYALMFEILDVWIFGKIWCRGWLVTDVWISTASILNLCAISVDRYVAVTRPVKYRSIMTPRKAKTIVACVWITSFLICFPPLLQHWKPAPSSSFASTSASAPLSASSSSPQMEQRNADRLTHNSAAAGSGEVWDGGRRARAGSGGGSRRKRRNAISSGPGDLPGPSPDIKSTMTGTSSTLTAPQTTTATSGSGADHSSLRRLLKPQPSAHDSGSGQSSIQLNPLANPLAKELELKAAIRAADGRRQLMMIFSPEQEQEKGKRRASGSRQLDKEEQKRPPNDNHAKLGPSGKTMGSDGQTLSNFRSAISLTSSRKLQMGDTETTTTDQTTARAAEVKADDKRDKVEGETDTFRSPLEAIRVIDNKLQAEAKSNREGGDDDSQKSPNEAGYKQAASSFSLLYRAPTSSECISLPLLLLVSKAEVATSQSRGLEVEASGGHHSRAGFRLAAADRMVRAKAEAKNGQLSADRKSGSQRPLESSWMDAATSAADQFSNEITTTTTTMQQTQTNDDSGLRFRVIHSRKKDSSDKKERDYNDNNIVLFKSGFKSDFLLLFDDDRKTGSRGQMIIVKYFGPASATRAKAKPEPKDRDADRKAKEEVEWLEGCGCLFCQQHEGANIKHIKRQLRELEVVNGIQFEAGEWRRMNFNNTKSLLLFLLPKSQLLPKQKQHQQQSNVLKAIELLTEEEIFLASSFSLNNNKSIGLSPDFGRKAQQMAANCALRLKAATSAGWSNFTSSFPVPMGEKKSPLRLEGGTSNKQEDKLRSRLLGLVSASGSSKKSALPEAGEGERGGGLTQLQQSDFAATSAAASSLAASAASGSSFSSSGGMLPEAAGAARWAQQSGSLNVDDDKQRDPSSTSSQVDVAQRRPGEESCVRSDELVVAILNYDHEHPTSAGLHATSSPGDPLCWLLLVHQSAAEGSGDCCCDRVTSTTGNWLELATGRAAANGRHSTEEAADSSAGSGFGRRPLRLMVCAYLTARGSDAEGQNNGPSMISGPFISSHRWLRLLLCGLCGRSEPEVASADAATSELAPSQSIGRTASGRREVDKKQRVRRQATGTEGVDGVGRRMNLELDNDDLHANVNANVHAIGISPSAGHKREEEAKGLSVAEPEVATKQASGKSQSSDNNNEDSDNNNNENNKRKIKGQSYGDNSNNNNDDNNDPHDGDYQATKPKQEVGEPQTQQPKLQKQPLSKRKKFGCALFDDKTYVIYSSLGSFYIPMLVMIFFYSRIYLVASRAQKALQRGYMTTKWPVGASGAGSGRGGRGTKLSGGSGGAASSKGASASSSCCQTRGGSCGGGGNGSGGTNAEEGANWGRNNGLRGSRANSSSNNHNSNNNNGQTCGGDWNNGATERVTLRIHRRERSPIVSLSHDSRRRQAAPNAQSGSSRLKSAASGPEVGGQKQVPRGSATRNNNRNSLGAGGRQVAHSKSWNATPPILFSGCGAKRTEDEGSSLLKLTAEERERQLEAKRMIQEPPPSQAPEGGKPEVSEPNPTQGGADNEAADNPQVSVPVPAEEEVAEASEQPALAGKSPAIEPKPEPEAVAEEATRPQVCHSRQVHNHHHRHHCGHLHHRHHSDSHRHHSHHHNKHHRHGRHQHCGSSGRHPVDDSDKDADNNKRHLCTCQHRKCKERDSHKEKQQVVATKTTTLKEDTSKHPVQITVSQYDGSQVKMKTAQEEAPSQQPTVKPEEFGQLSTRVDRSQSCGPTTPSIVLNWNSETGSVEAQLGGGGNGPSSCGIEPSDSGNRLPAAGSQGSGLSLMTLSLPMAASQVRKQSMMLLSSLTTRSSQTLRRLSMVASHPVDKLLNKSRSHENANLSGGSSSVSISISSASSSDSVSPTKLSSSAVHSAPIESLDQKPEVTGNSKKSRNWRGRRHRPHRGQKQRCKQEASLASQVAPKKTFDDYLMAVAGIDGSSDEEEDAAQNGEDYDDEDEEEEVDEPDNDKASCLSYSLMLSGVEVAPDRSDLEVTDDTATIKTTGASKEDNEKQVEADDKGIGSNPEPESKAQVTANSRAQFPLQRQGGYYERATSRAGNLSAEPRAASAELNRKPPRGVVSVLKNTINGLTQTQAKEPPAGGRDGTTATGSATNGGQRARRGAKRTSRWHAKRLHAETKAAKTVAIIIGGFIFCWLPFFTAYLSRAIICDQPDCIPQSLLSLFIWLGYLNSAINPVIYGLFSADFRHAFKNILCRCRFRNSNSDDTVVVSVLVDSIIKSIL